MQPRVEREQDSDAKASFQRRIQQLQTKQRELCLNEAKIYRVKILSSLGSGPPKSHFDPSHSRRKTGFLECASLVRSCSVIVIHFRVQF